MIGETTYGKGVGQTPILLSSMLMKRYLYLTVCATPRRTAAWSTTRAFRRTCLRRRPSDARDVLRRMDAARHRSGAEVSRRHWGATLKQLADVDRFETSSYDGFEAFYGALKTDLSKDQVREEVRRSARRRMEDEGRSG